MFYVNKGTSNVPFLLAVSYQQSAQKTWNGLRLNAEC